MTGIAKSTDLVTLAGQGNRNVLTIDPKDLGTTDGEVALKSGKTIVVDGVFPSPLSNEARAAVQKLITGVVSDAAKGRTLVIVTSHAAAAGARAALDNAYFAPPAGTISFGDVGGKFDLKADHEIIGWAVAHGILDRHTPSLPFQKD